MSGTIVKLYEGYHFKLTPEQVASIRDAMDEIEAASGNVEDERMSLLAQVWETETDGVVCCCHAIPAARAKIIREVLRRDFVAVMGEMPAPSPLPGEPSGDRGREG